MICHKTQTPTTNTTEQLFLFPFLPTCFYFYYQILTVAYSFSWFALPTILLIYRQGCQVKKMFSGSYYRFYKLTNTLIVVVMKKKATAWLVQWQQRSELSSKQLIMCLFDMPESLFLFFSFLFFFIIWDQKWEAKFIYEVKNTSLFSLIEKPYCVRWYLQKDEFF